MYVCMYIYTCLYYATSRKVASSNPDEVIRFISIYLTRPAVLWL
jgi:hypothetical protein